MNNVSRRKFIKTSGLTFVGLVLSANAIASETAKPKIKAVAFDGFAIFDPRPVINKVKVLFPEKGNQLIEIWKTKQFSYQWLRTTGSKYKNFWEIAKDALMYAASECQITLSEADLTGIMNEYKSINIWPDVKTIAPQLKELRLKLCILSNMTEEMILQGIKVSKTEGYFDYVLSTDKKATYKPSAAAYQMGVDIMGLKKEEILFVAFAGWDVAGSKWFGYPTYWVNRLGTPEDKLDAQPDAVSQDLTGLITFVKEFNS